MADDSWKDGYDEWKLQAPDDYDDELECEHDNYEIDILTGRAECDTCHHSWILTTEEIDAESERLAMYHEWEERENRRQWWRDLTYPVRMFAFRVLERIWPRKSLSMLNDDEIPF